MRQSQLTINLPAQSSNAPDVRMSEKYAANSLSLESHSILHLYTKYCWTVLKLEFSRNSTMFKSRGKNYTLLYLKLHQELPVIM